LEEKFPWLKTGEVAEIFDAVISELEQESPEQLCSYASFCQEEEKNLTLVLTDDLIATVNNSGANWTAGVNENFKDAT